MLWHFPLMNKKLPKEEQLKKIEEELAEVREEKQFKYLECIEAMDVLHAVETYLRQNYPADMILGAKQYVIQKNRQRGYYE